MECVSQADDLDQGKWVQKLRHDNGSLRQVDRSTKWIVAVVVLVVLVALVVAGLVTWLLLPRKMVVDKTAERHAMSELQPFADQLMSVEAPRDTAMGLDDGVDPCTYDSSTKSVEQPTVWVVWKKPSYKGPKLSGPTDSDRVEFRLLVDRLEDLGWKVDRERFVKGEDRGQSDRMDAVLTQGSGRGTLELELTTEGYGFFAHVTVPNVPDVCRVSIG